MSQLSEIVDTLENRISKLLHNYDKLKQSKLKLETQFQQLESQHRLNLEQMDEWKEKFESLKLAHSMLGSDQYKRDTKLKINALIREIDQCIAQLSE